MENFNRIRLLRLTLVSLIGCIVFLNFLIFGVVSAYSGTITLDAELTATKVPGQEAIGSTAAWNKLFVDTNTVSSIHEFFLIMKSPVTTWMLKSGNGTIFTCTAPNSCTGYASYSLADRKIIWDFDYGSSIIQSPIILVYSQNIFDTNNIYATGSTVAKNYTIVNPTYPVCLAYDATYCFAGFNNGLDMQASSLIYHQSSTVSYNLPLILAGTKFAGNVNKSGNLATKFNIEQGKVVIFNEGIGFNNKSFVLPAITVGPNLYINFSSSMGTYWRLLLTEREGGLNGEYGNITFKGTYYNIGNFANISVNLSLMSWGDTTYGYELVNPNNEVADSGEIFSNGANFITGADTASFAFDVPGTWTLNLYGCIYGTCSINRFEIASDTVLILGNPIGTYLLFNKRTYNYDEAYNISWGISDVDYGWGIAAWTIYIYNSEGSIINSKDVSGTSGYFNGKYFPKTGHYNAKLIWNTWWEWEAIAWDNILVESDLINSSSGYGLSIATSYNCDGNTLIEVLGAPPTKLNVSVLFEINNTIIDTINVTKVPFMTYRNYPKGYTQFYLTNDSGILASERVLIPSCTYSEGAGETPIIPGSTPEPTPVIAPGEDNINPVSEVDDFVKLIGMGLNDFSRFIFAVLIVCLGFFIGVTAYKNSNVFGYVVGFAAFAMFLMIEYIPTWVALVFVILAVAKLKL